MKALRLVLPGLLACGQSPAPTPPPAPMPVAAVATETAPPPPSTAADPVPTAAPPAPKPRWTSAPLDKRDKAIASVALNASCKADSDCEVVMTTLEGPLVCCSPSTCRDIVVVNKASAKTLHQKCQAHQLTRKPKPEGWTPCPPLDCAAPPPTASCIDGACRVSP